MAVIEQAFLMPQEHLSQLLEGLESLPPQLVDPVGPKYANAVEMAGAFIMDRQNAGQQMGSATGVCNGVGQPGSAAAE
jgi:hypothetical protein